MRRSPTTYSKRQTNTRNQSSPVAPGRTSMYLLGLDHGWTSPVGAAANIEGRLSWSR